MPEPAPAAAEPAAVEGDADFHLAMLLQAQFDEEHDSLMDAAEARANRSGGRVQLSMDRRRTAPQFRVGAAHYVRTAPALARRRSG